MSKSATSEAVAPPETAVPYEPGPSDAHDPLLWAEFHRAFIWLGTALLFGLAILLIQPILVIIAAIVLANMLDAGTRLLGRVLPIARGWRLLIVILAVFGFLGYTVWLTGSELTQQAAALPALVEGQLERISNWLEAQGIGFGFADLRDVANQVVGSLGKVTAALGTAAGVLSSAVMMLVLAIFIAVEPRIYARGLAWFFPINARDEVSALMDKLGSTLRRLMFGRLVGMAVEGVGTWALLSLGGVPMAALLGILTGLLAFLPNIGSIISGVLIILVGFSAGWDAGLFAIAVYAGVQIVDGYLIVPMVARRAVDIPPALVLGAQILFGTLFGVIGLALADPIAAMTKVSLEERAKSRAARKSG
jgi:predicted PurR-regulated permease PerM